MLSPEAAANELERTVKQLGFHGVLVNGASDGRFLDDPMFAPILARAEALDLPIYLHPGIPSADVRGAYYDGLPGNFSFTLALSAWGWHYDTAIHTLRLVLSGALDRYPRLKIVIGHMGEALPFMLDRIDETTAAAAKTHLRRSVRQTILDVLGGLSVRVERAGAGVPGRAAGVAGRSREDRAWQRGRIAAVAGRVIVVGLSGSEGDRNMSEAKLAPNLPAWMVDHTNRYLASGGTDGHIYHMTEPGRPEMTVPSLLLTTVGRKSGEKFIFPLFYGEDGGKYFVIASKGGAPEHPGWYRNILANPEVEVQVGTAKITARARTASGQERARLWLKSLEFWPPYADYQRKTEREIPVVVLDPVG
jgi:proline iminopeptidase